MVLKQQNGPVCYMFPGQGSQKQGMGEGLFEKYNELMEIAGNVLGYSVRELCLDNPHQQLGQTQFTQPALFTVNALMYFDKVRKAGKKPDYVMGHSLGEYNALLAAEVFDFTTGLKLVKKRGELMATAEGGGMAAVIGMEYDKVRSVLQKHGLDKIDLANINSPKQIVISGPKEDIIRARPVFESSGATLYVVLKVSGAFHSRYMASSRARFKDYLSKFNYSAPQMPVISNAGASPYEHDKVTLLLPDQMTNSVRWVESIKYTQGMGVDVFEEVGPGKVLMGLLDKIGPLEEGHIAPVIKDRPAAVAAKPAITAGSLGSEAFKRDYGLRYAYVGGGMYKGISSPGMVIALGRRGMLGSLGTGALKLPEIEDGIRTIKDGLSNDESFAVNVLCNLARPDEEMQLVDVLIKHGVRVIEAAAFIQVTPALIKYRLKGLFKDEHGQIKGPHRIMAKLSRPEVAGAFMSPCPGHIIKSLLESGDITAEEAELGASLPVASDVCVEADSGGHTDQGVAYALMPAMARLRSDMTKRHGYKKPIGLGAAGGIGTPQAAAAAFVLGADFILTGSINQCTVEAGTSDAVKDMLQDINVQDTAYAPASDMFEIGARVQVLRKGLFFPARANKLYDLYTRHSSLDEIDEKTQKQIQEKYFHRSFESVWEETCRHYFGKPASEIDKSALRPKQKMALIFKWYFIHSTRLALSGSEEQRVDYQVHTGPALGAFNQWVKGTSLEDWRNRQVADLGERLMAGTADTLNRQYSMFMGNTK